MTDNTPLTPEALAQAVAAIRERVSKARDEVSGLCLGTHKWRMSIPVQATDSDVVITSALNDVDTLLQALAAAEARAARYEAALQQAIELVQDAQGRYIMDSFTWSEMQPVYECLEEALRDVQPGTSATVLASTGGGQQPYTDVALLARYRELDALSKTDAFTNDNAAWYLAVCSELGKRGYRLNEDESDWIAPAPPPSAALADDDGNGGVNDGKDATDQIPSRSR